MSSNNVVYKFQMKPYKNSNEIIEEFDFYNFKNNDTEVILYKNKSNTNKSNTNKYKILKENFNKLNYKNNTKTLSYYQFSSKNEMDKSMGKVSKINEKINVV